MSTKTKQAAAKFDENSDYTFDLIVGRFMDTCEETESASNECTCADDVRKRVAEIREELGGRTRRGMARGRDPARQSAPSRPSLLQAALPMGFDPPPPLPLFTFHERDIRAYRCHADRSKKRRVPPCGRGLSSCSWCEVELLEGVWTCLKCDFIAPGNLTELSSR